MNQLLNFNNPLAKILSKIVDIVILNLLFILCCLPLITIGPSITALYAVTIKMAKDEEYQIIKTFKKAFAENFFQSFKISLFLLAGGIVLYMDFLFLNQFNGVFRLFLTSLLAVFGMIYVSLMLFLFPYSAGYRNSIKNLILNSLVIGLQNIFYTLQIVTLTLVPAIYFISSPMGLLTGVYFATFGGFALLAYLKSFLFNKMFSKYEPSSR
ncbi:DUF624 domain-containing protein [Metabacillus idriensis]|uniref:YesL family protein n=1 Tax=Metabacillus idriensis TaxID=324768 RepID=UPI0028140C19|nr:DUF624 domain-containing protein [Metabacillus idriensis]MDR0139188.1 DUF624 domain-containing protein [Metabacillus idriensis]